MGLNLSWDLLSCSRLSNRNLLPPFLLVHNRTLMSHAGKPIHDPFSKPCLALMPCSWLYMTPSIVPLMRCSCPCLTVGMNMSKLCQKGQYLVGAPLLSSTAWILLGMKFTSAAQVVARILFQSSIMTSRSYWMLDTWCFFTFRLRMPHMCSIGFRSGDILGHSITFTFSSKAVVILAVCLRWLCWKTVFEGRASSSASECHSTCWNPCFPQWTAAPQYQQ